MKVVYLGRSSRRAPPPPALDGDVIELLENNWDDYGYKTTFPVSCRVNGEIVELPALRLLLSGAYTTSDRLDELREAGWDGVFPIPDADYISVPSEITFYEQIEGAADLDLAIEVAQHLRDASFLVKIKGDAAAQRLVQSEGFSSSLQRERGSIKAYLDGWRIFERSAISVLNLGFRFENIYQKTSTLQLSFNSASRLPHDINVLIGPNGFGKSRVLHQIVEDWISPSEVDGLGFVEKPNLSQLVVVSYSPFERFPVDLTGKKLQDQNAYRYFGLRGRRPAGDGGRAGRIVLSNDVPKRHAAQALISCVADDRKYSGIRDWSQKVETVERVLRTAIDFELAAVEVPSARRARIFYNDTGATEPTHIDIAETDGPRRFIPITSDRVAELDHEELAEHLIAESGITFFKDRQPIELSSGQRLFAYIVINVLGAIRRNSLILIDEPELFLHPTLEIQFVDMLKAILSRFNSKAVLATHSVVTVREVPADCVHVFEKTDDDVLLKKPPFQTFGGDFQRISSYVFGDSSVSKPFEAWIQTQLDELGSAEALIEALGDDLNEELIVQIRAMGRDAW